MIKAYIVYFSTQTIANNSHICILELIFFMFKVATTV